MNDVPPLTSIRRLQTSDFSVQPLCEYKRDGTPPRITGCQVSNNLHSKVRDLLRLGAIIDLGVKVGIVERSGTWFTHAGQRIGQGCSIWAMGRQPRWKRAATLFCSLLDSWNELTGTALCSIETER